MRTGFRAKSAGGQRPIWPLVAGLWLVVIVTVVAAGLSPLSTGRLTGSDDYMRFVRVFTWLDGAPWHDQIEPRLTPPRGGELSWSRAVDLPLAAVVRILEPRLGRIEAAMWAATIVPAVLLLIFLAAVVTVAYPFIGRAGALSAALVALLLPNLIRGLLPGRVDHHGWQLVLAAILLGALARTTVMPTRLHPPLVAGAVVAVGLWIGGEFVPWLVLYNAALAILFIVWGRPFVTAGLAAAATSFILSVLILPAATPLDRWSTVSCDSFSITYVGLTAAALVFWVLTAALIKVITLSPLGRFAVGGLAAGLAGGGWMTLFSRCLAGPYAEIDPRLAADWLPTIGEAQGLVAYAIAAPGTAAAVTLSPLIGLGVSVVAFVRRRDGSRRRGLWVVSTIALAGTLGLAFWQIRVMPFASLAAIPALSWLVVSTWRSAPLGPSRRRRRLAAVAVLVLVGPLGTAFGALDKVMSPRGGQGATQGTALERPCDIRSVAKFLNDSAGLGAQAHVIAAPIDLGAEILFRTRHAVIGAPYHRNAEGILAIQDLFTAPDDQHVKTILRRYGADLLLICPSMPEIRLYRQRAGGDGLAKRLVAGPLPAWAAPVALSEQTDALLFRVAFP